LLLRKTAETGYCRRIFQLQRVVEGGTREGGNEQALSYGSLRGSGGKRARTPGERAHETVRKREETGGRGKEKEGKNGKRTSWIQNVWGAERKSPPPANELTARGGTVKKEKGVSCLEVKKKTECGREKEARSPNEKWSAQFHAVSTATRGEGGREKLIKKKLFGG